MSTAGPTSDRPPGPGVASPGSSDLPVAAVVLCGGTSRRFGGVDKTRQLLGGRTVLDTLLDALPAAWPVTCVGVARPTTRRVAWAREDPPLGGPAAGIAAGLTAIPTTEYVVVLAGDQPHAGPAAPLVADALAAQAPGVDGVAARGADGRPALLLAAYRRDPLRAALAGDVRDQGVYRTLARLRIEVVDVPEAQALDVDTPADLSRAARHDARGGHRG